MTLFGDPLCPSLSTKRSAARVALPLAALLCAPLAACGAPDLDEAAEAPDAAVDEIADEADVDALDLAPANCGTLPPDAVASLNSGETLEILQSSGGFYGLNDHCDRFIADFRVPASYTPPGGYTDDFRLDGSSVTLQNGGYDISQAECEGRQLAVGLFRRPALAPNFIQEASLRYVSKYTPAPPGFPSFSFCSYVLVAGTPPAAHEPGPVGTDTYRVAVKETQNGVFKSVVARLKVQGIPPS
jgi:hypothetical protein